MKIKKCLFPAAGYGTRFLPATKAMPKEMLPILDKPLIQYGVEEANECGIRQIGIITGRGKRAIEDHFDINYELEHQLSGTKKEVFLKCIRKLVRECTFSYTRQNEMKGLGHAILCGETLIGDEPFAVILADDLCHTNGDENVLQQLINVYEKYGCSVVALMEVDSEQTGKYGIIEGTQVENGVFKISNMIEKPNPKVAPSNLAIIGRYILTPDIFDLLKETKPGVGGEIQITDALLRQARNGKVMGVKFKGKRFDCGGFHGFVDATNYFYKLKKDEL